MAGVATEDSGAGGSCGSDQSGSQQLRCQAGEALAEWRSSEQVESGTPSTSPPYWDSDDEDDEGPRPSELYGKYTWKIEKFSQVNKRELRSSVFEVGSYKWYILIYPQGCDVCNHLSLFLCVSNHDKLLPGWSHLAQFTISVVHKDSKKSKYSDTLHRFWKKEHDWGWKKFIELPKVFDGFVENDSLVIKAQVQIIRERVDRPFRCLDCVYRRELIRVYLSNVQDKCRKFVEEKIKDLRKRIEDKARWTSLRAFWLGMDKSSRRVMSQGKAEPILKALVLQFFEHKEVVSTLIMDSLYSGMKAIDNPEKGKSTCPQGEELPAPVISRENDTFVLVDDMLLLLARAALEPLPARDEKGPSIPQNRTKEAASGEEFGKDSIERDERRLTELGRKTIEIFVFDHIFRKMDVALQEALSLKMQEELIREEEAACLADKEKKSKKKQTKQKKNHRKGKDKGRDEKRDRAVKESIAAQTEMVHEKVEAVEDLSDVSDSVDCVPEDSKGGDAAPVDSDTNVSELVDGIGRVSLSAVDDSSSSTCSSDSLPPTARSAPEQVNSRSPHRQQRTQSQGRNHDWVREEATQSSETVPDENFKMVEHFSSKASFRSSEARTAYRAENYVGNKDGVAGYRYRTSGSKDGSTEFSRNGKNSITQSHSTPTKSIPSKITPPKLNSATNPNPGVLKNPAAFAYKQVDRSILATTNPEAQKFSGPKPSDRSTSTNNAITASPKPEPQRNTTPKPTDYPSGPVKIEKPTGNPSGLVKSEKPSLPVMSRPLSAPLVVQAPKPAISSGPLGPRATPTLSRSVSATGRLGPEQSSLPSAAIPSYVPLSYRNAILGSSNISTGTSNIASGTSYTNTHISQNHSTSSSVINASAPPFLPRRVTQPVQDSNSKFSFGMMNQQDMFTQSILNDMQPFNLWSPLQNGGPQNIQVPAGTSGRQIGEDFQHLDIINDLLDDGIIATDLGPTSDIRYQNFGNHTHDQYSFPGDSSMLVRSMSSCGFEGRSAYHDNEFQNGYISSGSPYDGLMINDMILPEASPGPYMNGQLDGLIPNQWQMDSPEILYPGMGGSMDLDGYPYHHLLAEEYQNPSHHTIGTNGYPVFRSANGI